jgi:hypothetical protein
MGRPASSFPIALALGAIILVPCSGARADAREEGPTEIAKCQTISKSGSYKLVKNLSATGGADCLVITVDSVTIDLAGFSITGTSFQGNGISAGSGLEGIAVRNGSISQFQNAVDLSGASGSIVEGLRVNCRFSCNAGIRANGIVKGNIVSDAVSLGIDATGTVTGNNASSGHFGMTVGRGSTVIGNTASGDTRAGISVACPSNVIDNTAFGLPIGLELSGEGCHNEDNVGGP